MTRDEWNALAERCEKATGPDRELDWAIVKALGKANFYLSYAVRPLECKGLVPEHTASLDAITSLIGRELPSSSWRLHKVPTASPTRATAEILLHYERRFQGDAATLALALCAAFCRAMAAKETA